MGARHLDGSNAMCIFGLFIIPLEIYLIEFIAFQSLGQSENLAKKTASFKKYVKFTFLYEKKIKKSLSKIPQKW